MFKDVTLPVEIGTASLKHKDSHEPGWKVRLDLINPIDCCHEVDATLGDFIKIVYCELEDTRFKQMQFTVESSPCDLIFAPTYGDLVSPDSTIKIQGVQFDSLIKVIVNKSADDEELQLVLQLKMTIPKSENNIRLIRDVPGCRSVVRIVQKQTDMFDENKNPKTKKE